MMDFLDFIQPLFVPSFQNMLLFCCCFILILGLFLFTNPTKFYHGFNKFFSFFGKGIFGLILLSWFFGSISFVLFNLIYGLNYVGNFWDVFKFMIYLGFGGFGYIVAFKIVLYLKSIIKGKKNEK